MFTVSLKSIVVEPYMFTSQKDLVSRTLFELICLSVYINMYIDAHIGMTCAHIEHFTLSRKLSIHPFPVSPSSLEATAYPVPQSAFHVTSLTCALLARSIVLSFIHVFLG